MKRTLTSIATLAVATVASGGLLVGLAGSASAATTPPWEPDPTDQAGSLLFFDSSGSPITGGSVSSPIAAYIQGTATIRSGDTKATLYGYLPKNGQVPGQFTGEVLAGPSTYPIASPPGSVSATLPVLTVSPADFEIGDLIGDLPNTATDAYAGLYQLRLVTSAAGLSATTTYDSVDIQITGTGASATWAVVYPAPAAPVVTPTTTVLTSTPASTAVSGTSVTLNASVSPTAAGTVQFEDGANPIGTPVTVSGGTASTSTSTLSVGSHTLHAVFTPSSSSFSGSTGDETFTVTAPAAPATTTSLGVNPTEAPAFTPVSLTATVIKTSDSSDLAAGDGSVKFFDNGTTLLGSAPIGSGGVATLSYGEFSQGAHSITAQYVPAASANFATSTSDAVPFTADAATTPLASQGVNVTIPGGSLVITTPYSANSPFDLGTATLDPAQPSFTAFAAFGDASNPANGVTITDNRSGGQGWTASATATDFTNGGSGVINAENLTFTGVKAVQIAGNALQASSVVTTPIGSAASTGTPYASDDTGTDGLKGGPHPFATAPDGFGSVNIDGVVTLYAPTSAQSGAYTATLTFTVA